MEEVWKDIKGYEGYYKISNHGNVFSIRANKIMTPEIMNRGGYLRIGLHINGKKERIMVHRLVMYTFIEYRPYPEFEVNHKDMNTKNNRLDNLEWVTNLENAKHKYENKPELIENSRKSMSKIGKKYNHIGVEASKKRVYRYDLELNLIDYKESAREYVSLGFNYKNISQVCLGEKKTHKKYIFSFEKLS